jgi:hypothetical protein
MTARDTGLVTVVRVLKNPEPYRNSVTAPNRNRTVTDRNRCGVDGGWRIGADARRLASGWRQPLPLSCGQDCAQCSGHRRLALPSEAVHYALWFGSVAFVVGLLLASFGSNSVANPDTRSCKPLTARDFQAATQRFASSCPTLRRGRA